MFQESFECCVNSNRLAEKGRAEQAQISLVMGAGTRLAPRRWVPGFRIIVVSGFCGSVGAMLCLAAGFREIPNTAATLPHGNWSEMPKKAAKPPAENPKCRGGSVALALRLRVFTWRATSRATRRGRRA